MDSSPTTTNKLSFNTIAQNFGRLLETSNVPSSAEARHIVPEYAAPSQIREESLKPVFPAYQDLSDAVNGLNTKIGSIIKKHNAEYLEEYKTEMLEIQRELNEMRKRYEDFMVRQNGAEQIEDLKKQITMYKDAAVRLDEALVKRDKHIQVLKNKITFLEEERKFLNDYITNAVRKNKLISIERHTKPPKDSECYPRAPVRRASTDQRLSVEKPKQADMSYQDDKNDIFKLSKITPEQYGQDMVDIHFDTGIVQVDEFLNDIKYKDFGDKMTILKELEAFCKNLAITCERRFQDARKKVMKEKVRMDGLVNSKLIAKTELAEIFEDCVKRVKLNIEKRRLDGLKLGREGSEFAEKKAAEAMKSIKIEHKDFLSQDKEKLLEFFVFDETVLNVIKYLISGANNATAGKSSPRERGSRKNNQSAGLNDSAITMAESSETPSDHRGIRERRLNSNQPIRAGTNQSNSFNLPQLGDSQRDSVSFEQMREGRRTTSLKMEQLLGTSHLNAYQGMVQNRGKDAPKTYKA